MNFPLPGQYLPRDSYLHRSPALLKLLALLIASVMLLVFDSFPFLIIASLSAMLALFSSRTPLLAVRRAFAAVTPFFVLLFMVEAATKGLSEASRDIWRFSLLILLSLLLTATTSPSELIRALEALFSPLRRLSLPSRDVAVMVQIALRFIPILFSELERIRKAQKARAYRAPKRSPVRQIKGTAIIVQALAKGIIKKSEELSKAMEARGYRPGI